MPVKYLRLGLILAAGLGSLFFGFQNCSIMSGFNQVNSSTLAGYSRLNTFNADADLVWSMTSQNFTMTRLNQVSKWLDSTGHSIGLYPPLMPNSTLTDINRAPLVQSSSSGTLLNFGDQSALALEAGDYPVSLAQGYSVLLYVHNVVIPTADPFVVRLFELPPADGSESGYLGIQVSNAGNGMALFNAFEYYEGSIVALSQVTIPITSLTEGIGIAIRFSNDPSQMFLAVNGQAAGAPVITGAVPLLGETSRQIVLHALGYGNGGAFDLGQFALWKSELDDSDLTFYSSSIKAAFDSGGTVSLPPPPPDSDPGSDPGTTPGGGTGGTTNTTFSAVASKFTVCSSCHSTSSAAAVKSNIGDDGSTKWVTPGNSAGSLVVQALRSGKMPKSGPALSTSDIDAIAKWIDDGAN